MILLELIFILIIPAHFWSPVVYHEVKSSFSRRIVCNLTEAASRDVLCASHQICVLAVQNQVQDQFSSSPFNKGATSHFPLNGNSVLAGNKLHNICYDFSRFSSDNFVITIKRSLIALPPLSFRIHLVLKNMAALSCCCLLQLAS